MYAIAPPDIVQSILAMTISAEAQQWLRQSGFRNYCFISYPHTGERRMTEFAERIQSEIQTELRFLVPDPGVYLDTKIPPGADWPEDLRENLGGSVAMVAVIAPIYLAEEHEWCGREWEAMARLGDRRLPNTSIKPIIPVLFRKVDLPGAAGTRQPIDLSRLCMRQRYHFTNEFRHACSKMVGVISAIANLMHEHRVRAELDGFLFPEKSPFSATARQAPPLRAA